MKQTIKITVLLCFSHMMIGQDWRYELFVPKYEQEILSKSNLENGREHRILRNLSFIGAFQKLYARDSYFDAELEREVIDQLSTYEITEAKSLILSKSKAEQILIINESHHRPVHRKFTADLLSDLYVQGYRYLALEAILSNQTYALYPDNKYNLGDTTIMTRGYPLMKPCSGTYVKEPQFGNLLRRAIDIGYTIIGYEKNSKQREIDQAKGIARIFDMDPDAKVLVHCGGGHLLESPMKRSDGKSKTWMAWHLQKLTGINPYTVSQTTYFNYNNVNKHVASRTESLDPQCFIKDERVYKTHKPDQQDHWDLTVFHHNYEFNEGRPSWLASDQSLNVFTFDANIVRIDYPIRIKLLELNDRLDAVPIDIIESNNPEFNYNLYGHIEQGKIVVENVNGDRQILEANRNPKNID